MAGLVDAEAVLAEFEAWLVEDGRPSHGTDYLARKLMELRARHRVDESSDAATLRRFAAHLTDVFLGLLPGTPVTTDPLSAADPRTAAAMDVGATTDPHSTEGQACRQSPTPPPAPGCETTALRTPPSRVLATR